MKNKFIFTGEERITSTLVDGDYIWIAFLGLSNACALYKSSKFSPEIKYWDVDIIGDEVTGIIDDTSSLYVSLDDATSIGAQINKTIPSSITYYIKDLGITEKAIDLIDDVDYIYFLIPGIESGTNAKIAKYNKSSRAFVETIDLTKPGDTVENASKIDVDGSGNLWVVSELNSTPILTKVWYDSGWDFSSTILS